MESSSLLEDARRRYPGAPDDQLVIAIAEELVELLDLQPPVDPAIIASYQGVARIENGPLGWAGCLMVDDDQLVIRVRETDSPGRRRFTACHEVAHTFFPGYRHQPQYRCSPLATKTRRDPTEMLCDLAASELLLPRRYVEVVISEATFGLDDVEGLAKACDASLEAAARRFVSLWPEPSLFIRMELMTKPSRPHEEPKLRVSASTANGSWPYLPMFKSVTDDHVLNDCLEGIYVDCIASLDDVAGRPLGSVELHARLYGFVDSDGEYRNRVLVIARHPI